jgi:transposase-like protein
MDIDRLFEGQTVDVPCPKCGHAEPLSVPQLRNDPRFTCSGCGTHVQIDASQFREGLEGVETELGNLQDTIRRLGGEIE